MCNSSGGPEAHVGGAAAQTQSRARVNPLKIRFLALRRRRRPRRSWRGPCGFPESLGQTCGTV